MKSIKEIDSMISALIAEREAIAGVSLGDYIVYDNKKKRIDQNTWVLSPLNRADRVILKSIFTNMVNTANKSLLLDWLEEFDERACITGRMCPITNSPVCCAECINADLCEGRECKCHFVDSGDIQSVQECLLEV